jgi:beta-glucosidase
MMTKLLTLILALTLVMPVFAQTYPFENTQLSDDERLDNLISLMTIDEKVANCRRGCRVAAFRCAWDPFNEGLHGLL